MDDTRPKTTSEADGSADKHRHERVQRIFGRACQLPTDERPAFLESSCAGDADLRREVEQLLELDADSLEPARVTPVEARGEGSVSELLERVSHPRSTRPRYEPEEEIARGGMGAVLRVWDADLHRHLAMKVLLGEARPGASGGGPPGDARQLGRFLEEAQVTGQLDHPGIVPVHELGLDAEGRVFFTMKLVRGKTLKEVFDELATGEGGWTQTRVLGLILKVCEAMSYAHAKGVIHRDLKPANIMIGRFGEVYVMDWGLARVMTGADERDLRVDLESTDARGGPLTSAVSTELKRLRDSSPEEALVTMDGTILGTPCYMPPEQALGNSAELGPRTDVYALGAILYHLLGGTLPYVPRGKQVSPHVVLMALIHGPPPPLSQVAPDTPADLVAICQKAMAHEQSARYASAAELAADIQAYLEHRPVGAREHSVRDVLRLAYERNRPIVLTAAVGAVVLLVALALFVWRLQGQVTETRKAYGQLELKSSVLSARALLADAEELSITPESVEVLRTWIDGVRKLLEQEPALSEESARLERSGEPRGELQTALLQVAELRDVLPRVEEWERTADSLARRMQGEDAEAWAQAREAIASSSRYGGLDLRPQVGLVPLRENPWSGLWEFWHVASGSRPEVDPDKDDRYAMRPDTGIVLVLLPAGRYLMGDDSGRLTYRATLDAEIQALFLGKYEVTQGQWQRIMGRNPSQYAAGLTLPAHFRVQSAATPFTAAHPVEFSDWFDAERFCRRLGLVLPRESQWEYACRAGTATDWFWGDDLLDLEGRENLRDREAGRFFEGEGSAGFFPWNDGFPVHAPVGSFESNDFGMFDMHGNVSEWTANEVVDSFLAAAHELRFYRGGSWHHPAGVFTMAAMRYDRDALERFAYVGLRVARPLDP